jgi:hypothetical protein
MNAEWADDHPRAVVTAGSGEGLADFNHDSVLRVFPVYNYQKDEAVGGQSGTGCSEPGWSNVRSSITRVKEVFGLCCSGCLLATVVCQASFQVWVWV